jgi:rod shape-determining protein MreD
VLSFVTAFMLTAVPVPEWASLWRPAWVPLVLVYWCFVQPRRVGMGTAWMVGLMLDVLSGTLLGQHALGLSLVAFTALKMHQRIRVLPPWQQGLSIFFFVVTYQLLISWINGIRGLTVDGWINLTVPLTSMLIWPWVYVILRDLRRRYSH